MIRMPVLRRSVPRLILAIAISITSTNINLFTSNAQHSAEHSIDLNLIPFYCEDAYNEGLKPLTWRTFFCASSHTSGISAQSITEQPYGFIDWCLQNNQLSESEQHTVHVLLDISGSENCQDASDYLLNLTTLNLRDRQIENLTPLSGLTQLQRLYLEHNQISDIQPLETLQQLTHLYLSNNTISDLSSISQLENLTTLSMDNNQVQDLSPLSTVRSLTILFFNGNQIEHLDSLANLQNLTELYVANNQIRDIQPLASLTQLTHLDLSNNQIEIVESLSLLTQLIQLELHNNLISQVDFLSSLQNLEILDLRNTQISRKTCPVAPTTVCLFTDDAADLYQLGQRQIERSEFSQALTTFRTAMSIYRSNGDRLRESDTFDRIGNIYDELGQYANALEAYQQALAIATAIGDRQGESETLALLGTTYIRLGQFERAIETLQQAWDIYQRVSDLTAGVSSLDWRRQSSPDGLIFSSLSLAYRKQNNPAQSLRFAKQSLAYYRIRMNQTGEAIALARVGEAYLDLISLDADNRQLYLEKAQLYLEKALNLSQAENNQTGMARSLHGLGRFFAQIEEFSTALTYYQQAQDLRKTLKDAAGEVETLNAVGELLLEQEKYSEAADALQSAVELWESLRPGLTDADKISIAEAQSHTYRLLQKTLVTLRDIEAALEISERGRARAFAELLAHRLTLRGQTPPSDTFRAPTFTEIQHIAQTQQATLVEYASIDDELFIWVIEPTGNLHFYRQPFEGKSLSDWVDESRLALGVNRRGIDIIPVETGPLDKDTIHAKLHLLYQLLIDPIADVLPADPDAPIVIIPQDELFLVPFAALTDEEQVELIEHHSLLFAPAISFLQSAPDQHPALQIGRDPALVVGNPTPMPTIPLTNSDTLDSATLEVLPELPGAEQEARDIASILNTKPLIGNLATKSAITSALSEVAIAHFATHGLLDDFGTNIPGALALTPNSSAAESGFLTAAEIFELPIDAQLVVLSACDTGRGKITGDGIVGLSRSFLTAGVENVVVSLWSVDDDSTAYLMTEFYRQLQQTANPAIALRQAMRMTKHHYPHPYQWAAFTLFGRASE